MKNPKPRKRQKRKSDKLDKFTHLELTEYTQAERVELFTEAIHEMAGKGLLSPEETKDFLSNIETYLRELLES